MQKPTMTPRQQMEEWRKTLRSTMSSSTAAVRVAGKLGRAAMPKAEANDQPMGEGARQKTPIRYE